MFSFPFSKVIGILTCCASVISCGARTSYEPSGEDTSEGETCITGRQLNCGCPGGYMGIQVCLPNGTFGPCVCNDSGSSGGGGNPPTSSSSGGPTSSSSSGSTSSGGSSSSSSSGGPSGGGKETTISSGNSILIDAFAASTGIIVILQDAVELVDRAGTKLKTVPWPRDITTAAFDGTRLVVADKALMTSLDLDLNQTGSATLVESCASSILVSKNRFICGPANDWDRIFYTHDATTGALLTSSSPYTYNGIPMRGVPGTDEFITVTTDSSPSDFHLYSVGADDKALFWNESPYHGDFRVTDVYAFNTVPATHLITDAGLLLRIYGPDCGPGWPSTCLEKDGVLGTLSGSEIFLGMDNDAQGKLYGLVGGTGGLPWDPQCANGCNLQRIDVASHVVDAEHSFDLDLGAVIAFRKDPTSNAVVVGYRLSGDYYWPDDPYPGHRVALLTYE